jgi:hypothetical protein
MTIADYVVASILIVIIRWVLMKMPRRASRDHGGLNANSSVRYLTQERFARVIY